MRALRPSLPLIALVALAACGAGKTSPPPQLGITFHLTSPVLRDGRTVPRTIACDGDGLPPALAWDGAPSNTLSYAIIVSDRDAPGGTFVHWVVYAIPKDTVTFAGGSAPAPGLQGTNSGGNAAYAGPCPPKGDPPHHYRFSVYALSVIPDLPAGASYREVLRFIDRAAQAEGTLEATYAR